ncbi:unnamed protein product, partial [Brenthis ino]
MTIREAMVTVKVAAGGVWHEVRARRAGGRGARLQRRRQCGGERGAGRGARRGGAMLRASQSRREARPP